MLCTIATHRDATPAGALVRAHAGQVQESTQSEARILHKGALAEYGPHCARTHAPSTGSRPVVMMCFRDRWDLAVRVVPYTAVRGRTWGMEGTGKRTDLQSGTQSRLLLYNHAHTQSQATRSRGGRAEHALCSSSGNAAATSAVRLWPPKRSENRRPRQFSLARMSLRSKRSEHHSHGQGARCPEHDQWAATAKDAQVTDNRPQLFTPDRVVGASACAWVGEVLSTHALDGLGAKGGVDADDDAASAGGGEASNQLEGTASTRERQKARYSELDAPTPQRNRCGRATRNARALRRWPSTGRWWCLACSQAQSCHGRRR